MAFSLICGNERYIDNLKDIPAEVINSFAEFIQTHGTNFEFKKYLGRFTTLALIRPMNAHPESLMNGKSTFLIQRKTIEIFHFFVLFDHSRAPMDRFFCCIKLTRMCVIVLNSLLQVYPSINRLQDYSKNLQKSLKCFFKRANCYANP